MNPLLPPFPLSYSSAQPNRQSQNASGPSNVTKFQPAEKVFKKFSDKILLEAYDPSVGQRARQNNALQPVMDAKRREDKERLRVKDKADRATIEQVMDPRTRDGRVASWMNTLFVACS